MKNKNDSDARGMLATTRAKWAENRAGRVVNVARAEAERAREAVPRIERDVTLGSNVFVSFARAPNAVLFHLDRRDVWAGDHLVLRDVRLDVGREERVRVAGINGAGKTTLLKELVESRAKEERVLYLPQELPSHEVLALFERLSSRDPATRGRVLSIFAALGSDPAHLLRGDGSNLSPGEARKLWLADGLGAHAWALVLDEPTNHLDLPSIERLEQALVAYPGCIVMVTHDDAFAAKVTLRTLHVAEGTVS